MDTQRIIAQLLEPHTDRQTITISLPDHVARAVVEWLKQEADRHWWINANRSLELAELIIEIGQARHDPSQTALGLMARGDALKYLGRIDDAWEALAEAGARFQQAGDDIGWARTRIGRLPLSVELHAVAEALDDAERARAIFTRHGENEKRMRLDLNTATVHGLRGDHRRALNLFHSALATAETLGAEGQRFLGVLCTNIGNAYQLLGDFRQGLAAHERARAISIARDERRGIALAEYNIAHIAMAQGHYRHALQLLHSAHDRYHAEHLAFDATNVNLYMIECHLHLNRYTDARDLAEHVISAYHDSGATYKKALALVYLATAEAELAEYGSAQAALNEAESVFASLDADTWVATVRLRRGRIALQQNDPSTAQHEAHAAATTFAAHQQQANYAAAMLLYAQTHVALGDMTTAHNAATTALRIAQRCNIPALRYSTHLLLGHLALAQHQPTHAIRRYTAAITTVERVQHNLTITLRPGFLEDKSEALHALIAIHLRDGQAERAFTTLERVKSHTLLSYLANREHLQWATDDPTNRTLLDELNRLREEHQWYYQLAHKPLTEHTTTTPTIDTHTALAELATRERRMRTITERLSMQRGMNTLATHTARPRLSDIQQHLDDHTLLIEFYNDGTHLWAFTLDRQALHLHPLTTTPAAIDHLLAQLQLNITAALHCGIAQASQRGLTHTAERILQRLHTALVDPFAARSRPYRRLLIVPYGILHYLPFHLLHTTTHHLIAQHEIVILPTAGLTTRSIPTRAPGALILAHSWEGRLAHTATEAHIVQTTLGGTIFSDHAARRSVLQAQPTQVLHIAAHGAHRLDQPDLSHIQLDDGQLYTDDLLQCDLSYELVTLSACETGRANVAAGDELIGLGRGFLYAGAGALITSLWPVLDVTTPALMEHIYRALRNGASKAAALRDAQRAILAEHTHMHPAFWGAFQLVGDAGPLSTNTTPNARSIIGKEHNL